MSSVSDILGELIVAYEAKRDSLDKQVVQKMKEDFLIFHALFRAVYELFMQKGILRPDPYKNERHLSDIHSPNNELMSEAEMDEQLPIRLSEYDNLLDFLINYSQFSMGSFSLKKLKILSTIVKYIDWGKMGSAASNTMSAAIARLGDKIRLGSDTMAAQSLQSNCKQLDSTNRALMQKVKLIADFKREEYKLFIRQRIIKTEQVYEQKLGKDDFVKHVKSHFAKAMEGEGFYPELLHELWEELYQKDEAEVKKNLLEIFHVEEQKRRADTQKRLNLRDVLVDGVRNLGTSSRFLDESLAKLRENSMTLKSRPRTLMQKFRDWIISLSSGKEAKSDFYDLEIVDINTTMKKQERLNFSEFSLSVSKKSRYLSSLLLKNSPAYLKLEALKDDEIFDFLERQLQEIKNFSERLEALDTYFKSEVDQVERAKLKGIKVELGNLKNSLAAVNQKMHEYIAHKDEMEQLRKLGIDVRE